MNRERDGTSRQNVRLPIYQDRFDVGGPGVERKDDFHLD
jgi:hypothetical protein